jgi:pimeloyl-ACP methyl ester carboxylesterase
MFTAVVIGLAAIASATPLEVEVQISPRGLNGPLAGTVIDARRGSPAVLMLPGSGPIDRNGLLASGRGQGLYKELADSLSERGVSTLRIDKRGSFGSRGAATDAERVSLQEKAQDALAWSDMLRRRTGQKCVWILGHSEGGMVALLAAQRPRGICGLILVASPGRRMTDWVRAHLRADPSFAPYLEQAEQVLRAIDQGGKLGATTLPLPWQSATASEAAYWTDMARQNPSELASKIKLPILILQGTADRKVSVEDAEALAAAAPDARLRLLPGVNHLMTKTGEPAVLDPLVPEAILGFVRTGR